MDYRVRLGMLAGLAAGAVMLVLNLAARAFDLTDLNVMSLAGGAFLPGSSPLTGTDRLVGLLAHFALAMLFGVLFAFLVRPLPRRHYFLLGLVYGLGLYLVNMGLLGPAVAVMERPIWTHDALTMATHLVTHLVYGGGLGALVGANAPAAAPV